MFTEEELVRIDKIRVDIADRKRKHGKSDNDPQRESFLEWAKSSDLKKYLEEKYGKEHKEA